jgi:hypothetical protein
MFIMRRQESLEAFTHTIPQNNPPGLTFSPDDLEDAVRGIYRQAKVKYEQFRERSDLIGNLGYWPLCGPPKLSPKVFIVSLNPGASYATMSNACASDLFPATWPLKLNYLRRISAFSNQLADVFDAVDGIDLEDCVAGYRLIFRSKDIATWKSQVPLDIRRSAEEFSLNIIQELILAMKPELILTVGSKPFQDLVNEDREPESRPWGSRSLKLFRYGEFHGIRALGIPHISGAHLTHGHFLEIPQEIYAAYRDTQS